MEGLGLNNSVSSLGSGHSVFVDQSADKKEVDSHFSNVIRIIPCLNEKKQVVDLYFCDTRKNLRCNPILMTKKLHW